MKTISILFFLVMVSISFAQKDSLKSECKPCREHPLVNGPKFIVHGVMQVWNGMPSVRIWKIGTKRILGVSEGLDYREGFCNLPTWLGVKLNTVNEIIGDFVLYPFTEDKPGIMRFVCVDTAYNLIIKKVR
jgi:hypothetical protein